MGWLRAQARPTFLSLVVILLSGATASAATRYVSLSGSSTPPYDSWELATPRIAFAAQYAQPGDTIRVAAGTYTEPETILLNGGITLIGAGAELTELRNSGLPTVQIETESGNLTVSDIRFSGTPRIPQPAAIHFATYADTLSVYRCIFDRYEATVGFWGKYLEFSHCQMLECGSVGSALHIGVGAGNGAIRNNTIRNTRTSFSGESAIEFSLQGLGGGRFEVVRNIFHGHQRDVFVSWSPDTITIENNLFLNNPLPPPNQNPPYTWLASYVELVTPYSIVRNNFFKGVFEDTTGTVVRKPSCVALDWYQYAEISSNIFVGQQPGVGVNDDNPVLSGVPYSFEISYNCFWLDGHNEPVTLFPSDNGAATHYSCADYRRETDTSLVLLTDNICADPMFVDTLDYFLQQFSPCIDAGRPDILDRDGSRSDIGPCGGPDGQFYVYQDLPPQMPQGLSSSTEQPGRLSWLANTESDLSHYVIFRDSQWPPALDSAHVLSYVSASGRPFGGTNANNKQPPGNDCLLPVWTHRLGNHSLLHFVDPGATAAQPFAYAVIAVDRSGLVSEPALAGAGGGLIRPSVTATLPQQFNLEQNYPNPFNAVTAITYNLPDLGAQPAPVKLTIYNSIGQQVKVLIDEAQSPGRHTAYWDGTDASRKEVASGVYFYSLVVSGIVIANARKMILIK